jgi:hypothetical protein
MYTENSLQVGGHAPEIYWKSPVSLFWAGVAKSISDYAYGLLDDRGSILRSVGE